MIHPRLYSPGLHGKDLNSGLSDSKTDIGAAK